MMKIAIPVTDDNQFSVHYGGAARVALFEVDPERRQVLKQTIVTPPSPGPCGWPDWLHAEGVEVFLAGGMGPGPRQRLVALGVNVIVGVAPAEPADLVAALLQDRLVTGANACGSGQGGSHHAHGHAHGPDHAHEGHCHCAE